CATRSVGPAWSTRATGSTGPGRATGSIRSAEPRRTTGAIGAIRPSRAIRSAGSRGSTGRATAPSAPARPASIRLNLESVSMRFALDDIHRSFPRFGLRCPFLHGGDIRRGVAFGAQPDLFGTRDTHAYLDEFHGLGATSI